MKTRILKFTILCALLMALATAVTTNTLASPQGGGTFTVNDWGDDTKKDGELSLREAILLSNGGTDPNGLGRTLDDGEKAQLNGCLTFGSPNTWAIWDKCGAGFADTIAFNLDASDPLRSGFNLVNALPTVTDPVVIDGYSQPGATPNTSKNGYNANLPIKFFPTPQGPSTGLTIAAGNSVVKGLLFYGFAGHALVLNTKGGNVVQGNWFLYNGGNGIQVNVGSNHIGGMTVTSRNWLMSNKLNGIEVASGADSNVIEKNLLGGMIQGTAVGNQFAGLALHSSNNLARGNLISQNAGTGIFVMGGTENNVTRNSISANQGAGIKLNKGANANNSQKPPKLTLAMSVSKTVSGKVKGAPNSSFTVEFFSSGACDSSHFGEGKKHLGSIQVNTNAAGVATYSAVTKKFKAGKQITATATDTGGNTSEFSNCQIAN